jgi:hypothetical protein
MPYVPPALRNRNRPAPKKLKFRPVIDYTNLKTTAQLFEEYRKENYGKADAAFVSGGD